VTRFSITGQRLVAVFCLGVLLLNYPLLSLTADHATMFGIPALHLYVFVAWALLIFLLALVIERHRE
jgi:hypothetical protein